MLKYKVRPSKETEFMDFPIREFYVSPDLNYISGVTDYNVGLVDGEEVVIRSPYLIGDEINTINAKTVFTQGKVGVKITLPVSSITKTMRFDVLTDSDGCYYVNKNKKNRIDCNNDNYSGGYFFEEVEEKYVEYRGDISYFFHGEITGYLVGHKFYQANYNDSFINIETYVPIEDGKMTIGDYVYYIEFRKENGKPEITLNKYSDPIKGNEFIGLLNGYSCTTMSDTDGSVFIKEYKSKDWKRVTNFSIIKHENPKLEPDDVMYGGYRHYATYQDENYYLKDVYLDNDYVGYGIMMGNTFYENIPGTVVDDVYEAHKDLIFTDNTIYLPETDEYLEVNNSLVSFTGGGKIMLFIDTTEHSDIEVGNFIIAESNSPLYVEKTVEEDENRKYITYCNNRYDVKEHICDKVLIDGVEFPLTYLNDERTSASTIINGETLYLEVSSSKARLTNDVYYKSNNSASNVMVEYGKNKNWYTVIENSGVTINDINYPLQKREFEDDESNEVTYSYYVELYEIVKETFEVVELNGSSTYVCYPVVNIDLLTNYEEDQFQREITSIVVDNWKSFNFTLRKDTFGKNPFTPGNGLDNALKSEKPYSTSDASLLENKIKILRVQNYLTFKFPLLNKTANNLNRDDIIKNDFVNDIKRGVVNEVVDMEKDVYYPVYKTDKGFKPINQLRFNLHFRTRTLDNWKIIEDDREFKDTTTLNSEMSNWFIIDYDYYKNEFKGEKIKLQNASDLIGLMNFSTNEVKNQAKKISKSFLRLSYYSTNDKKTQVLLATSTIFLDENYLYKRYIDSHRVADLDYVDVKDMQLLNLSVEEAISPVITNCSEVYSDAYLNDNLRLSSRFTVNDKYNTRTSSEGYYIYMFKDYAKKMREQTIYLSIEFNHAGIGKTVQFMYPRKPISGDDDGLGRPLYLDSTSDVKTLKEGFKINDIYKQIYIPINVIYDEENNKYVYYLPDSIRENEKLGVEDEIMEFNLFEIKYANEALIENYNEDNKY